MGSVNNLLLLKYGRVAFIQRKTQSTQQTSRCGLYMIDRTPVGVILVYSKRSVS